MEQAIGYIMRCLSFIPGVAYAQQLPTPEAKLRAICDAVQNDAMMYQQARIKFEQVRLPHFITYIP